MTWQNALFVVAGVSLMSLITWAHHRFDAWWSDSTAKEVMFYVGAALVLVAGAVIVIFALKMK